MMNSRNLYLALAALAVIGVLLLALVGRRALGWLRTRLARPLPVTSELITVDGTYRNVVFLHHSTGHNLIAQGNVRALLSAKGYQFWDHDYNTIGLTRPDGVATRTSYGIPDLPTGGNGGGNTDPQGLALLLSQPVNTPPDNAWSRLLQHEVLIFKSCFPNSAIRSDEALAELKALYLGMRDVIDQHPDRLFILLSSPPLHAKATTPQEAARARALARWLSSDEFVKGHENLFVFDFFDLLADPTTSVLRADYQVNDKGDDSHPNALANQTIGPLFVDFVDQAVRTYRAGR